MKHLAVLCWSCVAVASPAFAQEASDTATESELKEVCKTVLCREPGAIHLKLPDGKSLDVNLASPTPIVTGDMVTVYVGETVNVEARVEAGRLVDLAAVPKIREPGRTLVFTLKQEPSIGDGTGMILKVESPFAGVVTYRLGMMLPTGDDLFKTSSCPLHAGKPVFENWPHPIFQIVAADFEFIDPESEAASACK